MADALSLCSKVLLHFHLFPVPSSVLICSHTWAGTWKL